MDGGVIVEKLVESVADNLLSVTILTFWVTSLQREKTRLLEQVLNCFDELKRQNIAKHE